MRTFRDCRRTAATADVIARLRRLARAAEAEAFLVEAGELEQGVLDRLRPVRDACDARDEQLGRLLRSAGAAYLAERENQDPGIALDRALAALDALTRTGLPPSIEIVAPEGYLHYALEPMAYARAAADYVRDVGEARAARAVVVGIRSIGTSLSGVVAAVVGSDRRLTVRPRGPSGERTVAVEQVLERQITRWLEDGEDVLVVDEGPGATGETFRCVAAWLERLGVAAGRIVLFPSHTGGMGLAPVDRRTWFASARKYAPPDEIDRVDRVAASLGLAAGDDLSAGRWRAVIPGASHHPSGLHHERRKYRARRADGTFFLLRYVGIGWWGAAAADRALRLAEAGIGPDVAGYADGFVARRWIEGSPAGRAAHKPALVRAATDFLSARAGLFPTGHAVDRGPVLEALIENAEEALGAGAGGLAAAVRRLEQLPDRPAFVADARLAPHEWIDVQGMYRKTDALDHGDGLRLPGPTDAAWDLAGARVEFGLDDETLDDLVRRCARVVDDTEASLREAVAAYEAPYAACCLGEMVLTAREAGGVERRRLLRECARYRYALRRVLHGLQDRHTSFTPL